MFPFLDFHQFPIVSDSFLLQPLIEEQSITEPKHFADNVCCFDTIYLFMRFVFQYLIIYFSFIHSFIHSFIGCKRMGIESVTADSLQIIGVFPFSLPSLSVFHVCFSFMQCSPSYLPFASIFQIHYWPISECTP